MPSIPARPMFLLGSEIQQRENYYNVDGSNLSDSLESMGSSHDVNKPHCFDMFKIAKPLNEPNINKETTSTPPNDEVVVETTIKIADETNTKDESESVTTATTNSTSVSIMKSEATKKSTEKRQNLSVDFEPLSTLYVFNDVGKEDQDYRYDIGKTWYSPRELKEFRADVFLNVNWVIMKKVDSSSKSRSISSKNAINLDQDEEEPSQKQTPRLPRRSTSWPNNSCASKPSETPSHNHSFYKNNSKIKEMNAKAQKSNYEFCERGVECRTPTGRYLKNKRRVDAVGVVMLYQQMQKQHRRQRRREERRSRQLQHYDDDESSLGDTPHFRLQQVRRHTTQDPEALRKLQDNIDAEALANVYRSYCDESISEALDYGQSDAIEAGMCPALVPEPYPSLDQCSSSSSCSEDDEFMDKLINLSVVHRSYDEDDDKDDEETSTLSSNSEESLKLVALSVENDDDDDDDDVDLNPHQELEASGVVEVELIEGNEEQPHRIHCFDPETCRSSGNNRQRLTSSTSCSSLPLLRATPSVLVESKPELSSSLASILFGRMC